MTKPSRKRHSPEQIIKKLREANTMLTAGKMIGRWCRHWTQQIRLFGVRPPSANGEVT